MLVNTIKEKIRETYFNNNITERSILKLLLGDIQLLEANKNKEAKDEEVHQIIRKFIKSNNEMLEYGNERIDRDTLLVENNILENFLPKTLDKLSIIGYINDNPAIVELIKQKKDKSIGIVMKHFKENNLFVQGKDLKEVIESYENN